MVEDSDEDYALLSRVFASDWDLRRWHSAEDALESARNEGTLLTDLSVLVVDLHLSAMDGVEFARRVRELPGGRTIFLCLLTGSRKEEDRRRGFDAGVDAFLVKPHDAQRLRELPRMLEQAMASR